MRSLAWPTATRSSSLLGVGTLALASVLALLWGSHHGVATHQGVVAWQAVMLAHALGAAALLCIACQRGLASTKVLHVLGLALLLRLLATQASPLLEDDHHRYLWDGMRTATALDPYRLAPEAFFGQSDLAAPWQATLSGINHPEVPTIYGPMLQALFATAYWMQPGQLAPLKALLLVADMLVLWLLARQHVPVRWLLAYAVHPLVMKEVMASAHPDGVLGLWLLLAASAWQRQQAWRVGVWLACALATKVAALVLLPLLLLSPTRAQPWAWAGRVGVATVIGLVAFYAPFVISGGNEWAGLTAFGQHWRFNPLLFRVIESALPPGWAALSRWAAAATVMGGVACMTLMWRVSHSKPRTGSSNGLGPTPPWDAALLLLIVMSPVVNPWYWLWALPLAMARQRSVVVVMAAVSAVSYTHSAVLGPAAPPWVGDQPFAVAWPITAAQLAALGVACMAWRISVEAPATKSVAPR
jgi:alpha-1,6-mannosyltransferase